MTRSRQDWQQSPSHWPHVLETERRLTPLELTSEHQGKTLEKHTEKHDAQDVWNKGFTIALAGLSSGLLHAKANDLIEAALGLLKVWKP